MKIFPRVSKNSHVAERFRQFKWIKIIHIKGQGGRRLLDVRDLQALRLKCIKKQILHCDPHNSFVFPVTHFLSLDGVFLSSLTCSAFFHAKWKRKPINLWPAEQLWATNKLKITWKENNKEKPNIQYMRYVKTTKNYWSNQFEIFGKTLTPYRILIKENRKYLRAKTLHSKFWAAKFHCHTSSTIFTPRGYFCSIMLTFILQQSWHAWLLCWQICHLLKMYRAT